MNKKLILLIEHDLLLFRSLKTILEDNGYRVNNTILSYKEAVLEIEKSKPDLVLVDLNYNGIKLAQYIHQAGKIPFILSSSNFDKKTIEEVKTIRPYGFVVKPFREHELLINIEIILNNFKHRSIDPLRIGKILDNEAPYRIRNIIEYINNNIFEKIEINDLAEISKWKVHHFIRIFSSTMGVTPYKYILERKMEIAKTLIETTKQPIQEISYDLSFQNYSNFYVAFKKNYNISPEKHRKKTQIEQFDFTSCL